MGKNIFTIIVNIFLEPSTTRYINIAILAMIVVGIIKGVKEFKKFIERTKQMDEKIDTIMNELEERKND